MHRIHVAAATCVAVALGAGCGNPDEPCRDCTPLATPDARAVLDPGEQVLGVRAGGASERTCAAIGSVALTAGGAEVQGTFTVPDWLAIDGVRVLAREGHAWKVAKELPASARSFTVNATGRVAVQAVRRGLASAPAEPAASGQGVRAPPAPREFRSHVQGLAAAGSLQVTLDASRFQEGTYRSVTTWSGTASAAAAGLELAADLEPVSVTWNGGAVDFAHDAGVLYVRRAVSANEAFEVAVELEHTGDPLDVRQGSALTAHLGSDWAFAAYGLRWYAEPADGSAAATTLSIVVPPGTEVAGPGLRSGPTSGASGDRFDFTPAYPAPALPFALGPFAAARSQDGRAASLHLPTCAKDQDAAWAANVEQIAQVEEGLFGALPASALTFVGLDADPANDPCTAPDPDGEVATLSRQGVVFGPSYLWEGEPTLNTDFFFAHETSHQWWGLAVRPTGVDVWLSEGMADHAAGLYVREARGKPAERDVLRAQLAYVEAEVAAGRDAPVVPASPAQLMPAIYYVKGSWVLRSLEAWMGEEAWATFLGDWAQSNLFTEVTTQEFRSRVRARLGDGADGFFDTWLHATGLPQVECADFYDPGGGEGEVLVHQAPAARFPAGEARPFVLPLHATATLGGKSLSGFAVVDGEDGVIELRP